MFCSVTVEYPVGYDFASQTKNSFNRLRHPWWTISCVGLGGPLWNANGCEAESVFRVEKTLEYEKESSSFTSPFDKPSHGRGIAFFFFQPVVFMDVRLVRLRIFLLPSVLRI